MKNVIGLCVSLFSVLLITLTLAGCDRLAAARISRRDSRAPAEPVFAVNTLYAQEGPIQDYLGLTGNVIAASSVDTFSEVAGRITRVFASVGRQVNRGDPIAEVDPSRPGMDFRPSIVRAPVSGTITMMPAQVGMTISQAVPLARISGGTGLEIQLHVAERFISRVGLHQPAEVRLDAWPGEIFHGTVVELSPTVDPVSRTMEIRVRVEDPGTMMKAGMFAKVRLITERRENVVIIPVSAVVNRFGEQFVFIADLSDPENPVAQRRHIVPGIVIDGVMEVRQGLAVGDEVITRGQALLDDGSNINIVERLSPMPLGRGN